MKQIDYTKKDFTVFIPTHYLDNSPLDDEFIGIWSDTNVDEENWLLDDAWLETVASITKLTEEIVVVMFIPESSSDEYIIGVFKGKLY